jgi:hypothetical protein
LAQGSRPIKLWPHNLRTLRLDLSAAEDKELLGARRICSGD